MAKEGRTDTQIQSLEHTFPNLGSDVNTEFIILQYNIDPAKDSFVKVPETRFIVKN